MHRLGRFCITVMAVHLAVPVLAQTSGSRPEVDLQCASFGKGPMLECIVRLQRKDGAPLGGTNVTLGALMPSMPMAHTIKPVKATPSAKPGEYRATIELEMPGVWAIEVDISGPVRDKVLRNLLVIDCESRERCAAQPAKSGENEPSPGRFGR